MTRFETYCERREKEAVSTPLTGFYTIEDASAGYGLVAVGSGWTRRCFDGDFYRVPEGHADRPSISLVFVQSRGGNTVADDPSTLGGGNTVARSAVG